MTGLLTGVVAGHEASDKGVASRDPQSPQPHAGGGSHPTPTAEILSFERGETLLRPPGTRTANLWRRNKRWAPSNADVYTPPEPMRA